MKYVLGFSGIVGAMIAGSYLATAQTAALIGLAVCISLGGAADYLKHK